MPADQAAGLRRRSAQQPLRCIHGFFHSPDSTIRLAQALQQHGWTSLLIDTRGRLFAGSATQSLFDWRQQLARQQLHTQAMPHGDGWHAPGLMANEPGLRAIAQRYDCLLFDASLDAPDWLPLPDVAQTLILEVNAGQASMQRAYALLKTLSHLESRAGIGLLGDAAACDRLQAACRQYLEPAFVEAVHSVAHEDDAFAALAVRMADEETRLTARYITGTTGNMALKHGG
jgi:hypothetical protein